MAAEGANGRAHLEQFQGINASARDVSVFYGNRQALDNVSLDINRPHINVPVLRSRVEMVFSAPSRL